MENLNVFKTPKKTLAKMQVVHLGKILFNLQFVALAIMLASVISFIMPAIYYLMLIFIALLTLFVVFSNPNFISYWQGGEMLTQIAEVMQQTWKFTVPIVLVLSIASIVCLAFDKQQKHIARISISAIICVITIIVLIAKLINGGA